MPGRECLARSGSGGGRSSHDPGLAEGDDLPPHKDYGACEALLPVANRPLLHYPLRSREELFAEDLDGMARGTHMCLKYAASFPPRIPLPW